MTVAQRPGQVVLSQKSGPGTLVRAVWFIFVGWWLTGLASLVAWVAMATLIGLPLGIYLVNRIPTFLTLRPRSRQLVAHQVGGQVLLTERGLPQKSWPIRFVWFLLVGWWASAIWMAVGYLLVLLIVTLPLGLMMYNRVPAIASLYRY